MSFDFHFAWVCAVKDLRRRLRDPIAMLLWIGLPLVIAVLIQSISGGDGVRPRGKLLFADLDDSFVSRAVASAFSQGELGKMFDLEPVELEAGRKRIHDGDGSALVVVPLGFGEALLLDKPTQLEIVKNPSRQILPRIAEETLGLAADAVFYAQRIAGDRLRKQIETIVNGPPEGQSVMPTAFVAGFSIEINNTIERLSRYFDPLVLTVDLEPVPPEDDSAPRNNFALLFFPSMLFLALLFMAQGLSEDLWREKALGTLRRATCAPGGIGALLLGKFLCATILIGVVAACGMFFALLAFGLDWSRAPLGLLWITLCGAFLFAGMVLIQVHAKSQRGGNLLTNSILFPLSMIGGAFFPFEAMPDWMSSIGRLTPNGWALEEFKRILFGESHFAEIASGGIALAVLTLFLLWWAVQRTRSAFVRA
ncbi:MAG TPA: ABC transporter permease [Planctomycetota bacterium]|nr:ABC transporter permease [Planctomycetota bacterium]